MSDLDRLQRRYEEHHRIRRDEGEFVFVPERVPLLVDAVGGPGRRVLDLGCRTGAVTRHFSPGNQVVGVDVDRAALERVAELGVEPVWADVEQPLPFADASFDAVVAGELLEHVRYPEEVVAEILRVLRPNGVLAGSVPNAYRLKSRLLFLAGRPPEDDPTHLHMYSPSALLAMFDAFDRASLIFVGGRFTRLGRRLFARDVVFIARKPEEPSHPSAVTREPSSRLTADS